MRALSFTIIELFAHIILFSFSSNILRHSVLIGTKNKARSALKSNDAIVLCHGLLGSAKNFYYFAKVLSECLDGNYDIICIDARNHGRSAAHGSLLMNYKDMAHDVITTLNFLSINTFHIVGHSMGGKIAAAVALEVPNRCASLSVLDILPIIYDQNSFSMVCSTVKFLEHCCGKLAMISKNGLVDLLQNFTSDNALRLFLLSNVQTNTNGVGYEWKFNIEPIAASIDHILDFPTYAEPYRRSSLFIKAERSSFIKLKDFPKVHDNFPNFRIVTVRNASHWLHVEKPMETCDILASFIKSI
jgi:esterase